MQLFPYRKMIISEWEDVENGEKNLSSGNLHTIEMCRENRNLHLVICFSFRYIF